MNKVIITSLTFLILLISCNSSKKQVSLDCSTFINQPYVENAVYNFEKDASAYLKANTERSNTFFLRFLLRYSNGYVDFSEMVAENTLKSLKELKSVEGLYSEKDGKLYFNFDSEYYRCLYNGFPDNIKTIFDQLDKSGFLNSEYTAKSLQSQDRSIVENESIKAYIILAIYYPTIVNNSSKKTINLN